MIKIIIIPGNGNSDPGDIWYPYLKIELEKFALVINVKFPDPVLARQEYWLPFITELGADENTVLIGHSSGAVAAMRYAETHKIFGSVLVGACYTDLGLPSEKASHYYDQPWQWDKIKLNQNWIVQFASTDDPFIPITEADYVHKSLQTEYHTYADRGHFTGPSNSSEFPEIVEIVKLKLQVHENRD